MPPTNKIMIVKNNHLKFIWPRRSPTITDAPAKERAALNGEFNLVKKTTLSKNSDHKIISSTAISITITMLRLISSRERRTI